MFPSSFLLQTIIDNRDTVVWLRFSLRIHEHVCFYCSPSFSLIYAICVEKNNLLFVLFSAVFSSNFYVWSINVAHQHKNVNFFSFDITHTNTHTKHNEKRGSLIQKQVTFCLRIIHFRWWVKIESISLVLRKVTI